MRFRDKLVRLCSARGWSQADLWRAVGGISKNTVSRWWSGDVKPFDDSTVRLARALRVSLDYLLDDEVEEVPAVEGASRDEAVVLDVIRALKLSKDEALQRLYIEIKQPGQPDQSSATVLRAPMRAAQ